MEILETLVKMVALVFITGAGLCLAMFVSCLVIWIVSRPLELLGMSKGFTKIIDALEASRGFKWVAKYF